MFSLYRWRKEKQNLEEEEENEGNSSVGDGRVGDVLKKGDS